MPEPEFKTFEEWNAAGRRINRGAKATFRDGKFVFEKGQTYNPPDYSKPSVLPWLCETDDMPH